MEEVYSKLFFLLLGGVSAWLVNKLGQRAKVRHEEEAQLRLAYARWYLSTRSLIDHISWLHHGGGLATRDHDSLTKAWTELTDVLSRIDKVWESMYEVYFLEPVEIVRENIRLMTENFGDISTKLSLLQANWMETQRSISELEKQMGELQRRNKTGNGSSSELAKAIEVGSQELGRLRSKDFNTDISSEMDDFLSRLEKMLIIRRKLSLSQLQVWRWNRITRKLDQTKEQLEKTKSSNAESSE